MLAKAGQLQLDKIGWKFSRVPMGFPGGDIGKQIELNSSKFDSFSLKFEYFSTVLKLHG